MFVFTRDMIIFFYDRKHSTFFQWEYMNSSHAHLKWHFKGRLGPRRHRSLGNLSGHQVASKAADSESCLDWTREAPTTLDIWDHLDYFWCYLYKLFFMIKTLVCFVKSERWGQQTCRSCCSPCIYRGRPSGIGRLRGCQLFWLDDGRNSAGDPDLPW